MASQTIIYLPSIKYKEGSDGWQEDSKEMAHLGTKNKEINNFFPSFLNKQLFFRSVTDVYTFTDLSE